jgi:septum formation protein
MNEYNIILASKSPRRQQLLKELGLNFTINTFDVVEEYPEGLSMVEIPVYLAKLKSIPFQGKLEKNDLVITADTIVWHNNTVLGKPKNKKHAIEILSLLSNSEHQVITGVCLTSAKKQVVFYSVTNVMFKTLLKEEINYYIDNFKPFDKAGAYGIQEWIGYIGITHIEGSFYNVMGLPVQKLYSEIQKF